MASTYDLELLEDFVCVTLNPRAILHQQATATQFAEWEGFVSTESIRIKKRMKAVIGKPGKDRYKERYIQRNQQDIIILKNTVVNYLLPKTFKDLDLQHNEPPLVRLYKLLFRTLKELLEYIEEFFKQYFNLDENLPDSYLMRSQYFIRERLKVIRKKAAKTEADMQLLGLIITQIENFCTTKASTYRNYLYIKRLTKELETIVYAIETIPEGKVNGKIVELLCYLNFNCSSFANYLITEIIANVNACESQNERIERLAQYFKEYSQMPVKPNTAFKPKMQNIKEQLTTWISEELYFLEQKQRLLFIVPPANNEAPLPDEDKIHFSISAEILSLLARAAKDSKLISNKQNTSMYKSLVRFVRTAHTHTLSANSLLKKGYVAERSAKLTAINILHEMIKHIHKY